jgi:hypothetical protein
MSCTVELYIGNSNVVELQTLTNSVTNVIDTGATVTVTLTDTDGTEVTGQAWPTSMPHASPDGTYRATLEDDLVLVDTKKYIAVVDAIGTAGEVGHWEQKVIAATRDE